MKLKYPLAFSAGISLVIYGIIFSWVAARPDVLSNNGMTSFYGQFMLVLGFLAIAFSWESKK